MGSTEPPEDPSLMWTLVGAVVICASLALSVGFERDEATTLLKACFTQEPFADASGRVWACQMREMEVRR